MDNSGHDTERDSGRRLKVARLIETYDLTDVGAELERRWTATGEDRWSLRSLATYFNRQLLAKAMANAGMETATDRVETTYRYLTDDEASGADRTRVRRRLEQQGVPVERLRSDFVSYQAIRTYLQEQRGAERDADESDTTANELAAISRLRGRTKAVTESKLELQQRRGDLVLGDGRLFLELTVLCTDCGQRYEVEELIERGGCDCAPDPETDSSDG